MHAFGDHKTVTNIHNMSTTAANRLAAQFIDAAIWIDEWKNSVPKWKQEFVKAFYDRSGRLLAEFSNDNATRRVQFGSPLVLTGQDIPGQGMADPAIFSRCIHLYTRRTEHDESALAALKDEWRLGITHITLQLQAYRGLVAEQLGPKIAWVFDQIKHSLPGKDYDSRMLTNYACLLAPGLILHEAGKIDLGRKPQALIEMAAKKIAEQMQELASGNELGIFWHVLEELKHETREDLQIKDMLHYRIDGPNVGLHLSSIYDRYKVYCSQKGHRMLDKSTLISYLQGSQGFVARGVQQTLEHSDLGTSFRYPGAPYRFEKSRWALSRRAPLLGEHTEEVLAEVGISGDALTDLIAAGVG